MQHDVLEENSSPGDYRTTNGISFRSTAFFGHLNQLTPPSVKVQKGTRISHISFGLQTHFQAILGSFEANAVKIKLIS